MLLEFFKQLHGSMSIKKCRGNCNVGVILDFPPFKKGYNSFWALSIT